jgi:hypothetical protein
MISDPFSTLPSPLPSREGKRRGTLSSTGSRLWSSAIDLIDRQPAYGDIPQTRKASVLLRKQWIRDGPFNTNTGITPKDSPFALRCIEVAAFIVNQGCLAKDTEAVRKSFGDIELPSVFIR